MSLLLPISFILKPHPPPKLDHHFLDIFLLQFSDLQIPKGFLRLFRQWDITVSTMTIPMSNIEIFRCWPKSCLLTISRAWCRPSSPISFIGVTFVIKKEFWRTQTLFKAGIFIFFSKFVHWILGPLILIAMIL